MLNDFDAILMSWNQQLQGILLDRYIYSVLYIYVYQPHRKWTLAMLGILRYIIPSNSLLCSHVFDVWPYSDQKTTAQIDHADKRYADTCLHTAE